MDVYENNAFTFKIANSGSVTWNGSIYLVFSSGTTIDLGSWSVQPGYVNYCVSCYFVPGVNDIGTINAEVRYQTNGIGSSIRVASQINGYVNVRPLAPILTSPTSGASISTGSNIGFTWNTNGNPSGVSYNLRIRNISDNVVIFDQSVGSVSSYFLTSSNFTVGKNYQWIVTAVKGSVVQESFPANSFSIVGQPNITMGNNVTFGTTTLYSGVNYTGTFSITNNGSAPWSGSMYVILSTGASLDGGSATINAGTTRNYSVSYTPNITASNVGVAASYQTGGTGSGITVPNQNASNINIIGNLGITGNTVSPSTGNQNSTNFTFTANLSNVAPSPTLAPTVDIEFRAPDGLTYTTTNIPNIGGTTYSKTQTLQQVGTYEYRYISYQSTRPNAFTAWQSLSVSNPQSVNVTSPALNSTHTVGNNLPIAYAFTGYTGNVSIELTQGTTGTTAFRVIADPTTNLTGFSYQIPLDVPAGQYRVKVYNTGSGTLSSYSQVFTINALANCPVCFTNQSVANFTQTGQEGFCAAQYLCSKGIIQNTQPNPSLAINREDVAKIVLLGLLNDNANMNLVSLPSDNFPSPFNDLTNNGNANTYHRYAKALSYLQYNDAKTPFDRSKRPSFNPADNLLRIDYLKLIIEAWNEPLDASSTLLYFNDVSLLLPEQINYLKKAVQLGVVINGTSNANQIAFRPNEFLKREEAFLVLARQRIAKGNKNAEATSQQNYYVPFNQTITTAGLMRSMAEGNFSNFGEGGFEIPDVGFSLGFDFQYQSSLTELPDEWRNVVPLGNGWTHRYNSYIFATVGQVLDPSNAVVGKPLLMIAWADGSYDTYDNTTPNSPIKLSIGNFNALTRVSATQYTIKTKAQVVYTFTQQGADVGLFRLSAVTDRYGNAMSLAYKNSASPFSAYTQVLDYVQVPSGRRATFSYDANQRITNIAFPGQTAGSNRNLTFTYNGSRLLQTFKDAKGQTTGGTTTYGYDAGDKFALLKSVTYPKGNKIEVTYNGSFKATAVNMKNAGGATTATTTISPIGNYNSDGSYAPVVTGMDNVATTFGFNANGINTSVSSNAVNIQAPTNNATHPTLPSLLNQNGKISVPTYDTQGNVTGILRPDGKTETFTFDAYNNLTAHTDAKGIATVYNWITSGKFLSSVVRPIGNGGNLTQSMTYNTNGTVATTTNNEGIVATLGYNTYGNVNQTNLPILGLSSTAVYDYASRVSSSTNAKGQTTSYLYDNNDNPTRETNTLGHQTNFVYDLNDNLQTITNAKGGVTTLGYDAFDRPVSEEFGGRTKTYTSTWWAGLPSTLSQDTPPTTAASLPTCMMPPRAF